MVDVVDTATRSRMMSGIQSKNTRPEILVRKGLHARGLRYSLHAKDLPGKPDIVMPKWKVAIFVHGCFWHWHGCALSKLPSSNTEFWTAKLTANKNRDEMTGKKLRQAGWRVAIIWECNTRGTSAARQLPKLLDDLSNWIRADSTSSSWSTYVAQF
jgi:DNA mismatch endonuclease, patch repair protein